MNPIVLIRIGGAFVGGVLWGAAWSRICDRWIEPALEEKGVLRPDAVRYRPESEEVDQRLAAVEEVLAEEEAT